VYKKGDKVVLYSSIEEVKDCNGYDSVSINAIAIIEQYSGKTVVLNGDWDNIYGMIDVLIDGVIVRMYKDLIKGYAEEQIIPITDHKYNIYGHINPIRCTQVSDGGITFMGKSDDVRMQTQFYISDIESEYIKSKLPETNTNTPMPPVKPPLGLIPLKHFESITNKDRINDIIKAMTRYSEKDKVIPLDWISELYGRISKLGEE